MATITYKEPNKNKVSVFLDGKLIGHIIQYGDGFQYHPKGSTQRGEKMKRLCEVKWSLEVDEDVFMFAEGETYETQAGEKVTVLGRTFSKGYECLRCSDHRYRYDRSNSNSDAGRVTGTNHDYSHPHNFKRPDRTGPVAPISFNENHPELREGERHAFNAVKGCYITATMIKEGSEVREGEVAYKDDGSLDASDLVPVFVKLPKVPK